MILNYKFNQYLWLKDDFVDWLEAAAMTRFDLPAVDIVLPMPITLFRRWDRGYNQCDYLARDLARRLDRKFDKRILKRVGHPARQSELDELSRRQNVVGTISVVSPSKVRGRTVLLVDDIMTTGATLSECAKVLKCAGAAQVWAITIARSVRA